MYMSIQGTMLLNNHTSPQRKTAISCPEMTGWIKGEGCRTKHSGKSQHDAEVTLETASCFINPAIVIDAVELYAQNA